jgi:RNA polymerase primary sigma factor
VSAAPAASKSAAKPKAAPAAKAAEPETKTATTPKAAPPAKPAAADKSAKTTKAAPAGKGEKPGKKAAAEKTESQGKGEAKGKAALLEEDAVDVEADFESAESADEAEIVEAGDAEAEKAKAKPLRMKVSRAKERALMREFGLEETTLTEEEVAKRRQELKTLIKMGKTRGFLTHQEINDHLPEKLVNEEILEAIISMLNDMGIAVYEQAPDAATMLISGSNTGTATDEEAEEAAEAEGPTAEPARFEEFSVVTAETLAGQFAERGRPVPEGGARIGFPRRVDVCATRANASSRRWRRPRFGPQSLPPAVLFLEDVVAVF